MSKIIEELSQKAIEKVSKLRMVDGQEEYSWKPEDYDRAFAELIVQECIECIQLTTARDPRDTPQYKQSVGHIHRIRQHFGIEETPTPVINVDMVKRLREETNKPMMDCKMALCACDGDYEQAKKWLHDAGNFRARI
jgi:hypothetical protein